jgi:hypothetical protein
MSIDLDVLIETYTILKQYIPSKDRQEAADNLMSVLVDLLSDDQLREFGAVDAPLSRALKEYVTEDDSDYDEDE